MMKTKAAESSKKPWSALEGQETSKNAEILVQTLGTRTGQVEGNCEKESAALSGKKETTTEEAN